jgi:hypothetical protein
LVSMNRAMPPRAVEKTPRLGETEHATLFKKNRSVKL